MRYIAAIFLLISCGAAQIPTGSRAVKYFNSEFLYWCAQDGEWPVYGKAPKHCATVSRGTWDHYPITVNTPDDALVIETLEAIDGFNAQVGFELFRFDVASTDPDVIVHVAGPHFRAAAEVKHNTYWGKHYASVRVYNGLERLNRSDILMHELGHVVGLRHDLHERNSMMYPSAATRVAFLEAQDVKALRAIYLK